MLEGDALRQALAAPTLDLALAAPSWTPTSSVRASIATPPSPNQHPDQPTPPVWAVKAQRAALAAPTPPKTVNTKRTRTATT